MRQTVITLILATLVMLAGTSQAAMVKCLGTKCGGTGLVPMPFNLPPWPVAPVDYLYGVTVNDGDHFNIFQVGTHDGDLANYTGIYATSNWFGIGGLGGTLLTSPFLREDDHTLPHTPHGSIVGATPLSLEGSGPDGQCPYVIQWLITPNSTPGLADTYYFGFNNINEPHDVGGTIGDLTLGVIIWDEDWQQAVGMGAGPLHGPIPEPATMSLLLAGGLVLMRRRRK